MCTWGADVHVVWFVRTTEGVQSKVFSRHLTQATLCYCGDYQLYSVVGLRE